MCGRYTLTTPVGELADLFGVAGPLPEDDVAPRYNVAPSQEVLAVVAGGAGERRMERARITGALRGLLLDGLRGGRAW